MPEKFYITTPIYYVNASPHIGHAYTQIACDAISRFHKLMGHDVFFLTGTDEHGEKISEASLAAGFEKGREKEFVDSIAANFKLAWDQLNVKYTFFLRTTCERHKEIVQECLNVMKSKGDIYKGEYDGWFCAPCETFWTEKQIEKETCPDCGRPVEHIIEENYFFRMSKYQKWLTGCINANPNFIMPAARRNETLGFLKEPLGDLCVSRPKERMSWGVELPFDKGYVVYVWFDALINYISALKISGGFDRFWPADFHVIAKDILRHHTVYWPIMLKSMDMRLPRTIFAHGWWKMGKEKMSKSKGNIQSPLELENKYGADPLRFFLLKAIGFGLDGDFSEDALVTMYNSDLANDLGNLLNRTLVMVEKYFNGVSPKTPEILASNAQGERSARIKEAVSGLLPKVKECMFTPCLLLKEALEEIMKVVGFANKYIEESAPWQYAKKNDTSSIKLIIVDLLEVLRKVAIGIYPFMPQTAQRIWDQLGLGGDITKAVTEEEFTSGFGTRQSEWRRFPYGTMIAKGEALFPRIETS